MITRLVMEYLGVQVRPFWRRTYAIQETILLIELIVLVALYVVA